MQKVNYYEYAVNNIVTIPQKPLTPHYYTTVEGLVFDFINWTSICLDTDSIITFIDKALIDSHKQLTEAQKLHSITAYSLTEKQVLNCLIHLSITISVRSSDSISFIIQITTTVYVIDGLKVSVLLKINIIVKKRAKINLETHSLIIQGIQVSIIYFKLFYTSFHATVWSLMYKILTA